MRDSFQNFVYISSLYLHYKILDGNEIVRHVQN